MLAIAENGHARPSISLFQLNFLATTLGHLDKILKKFGFVQKRCPVCFIANRLTTVEAGAKIKGSPGWDALKHLL
jgi:hypothetical protein